jgi:branched-chain amino acid transport system substrate-binding protein
MMKKNRALFSMVIALTVVMISSFSYGDSASKVVVDKWEIPFINAWTGPAAGYGIQCEYFQTTAVDEINAAGGISGKPIVIEKCDEAMETTRAASCMKKAVEKSLVVLGPMTSLSTQVAAPIAAKSGVMAIPPVGGWETIKDCRPWAVVLQVPNLRRAEFMMNTWIDRNPEIKKVVMLGVPTVAQWAKYGLQQIEVLEKRGVKVLDNIDVAAGAVDVSSVIIRALTAQPDGIILRTFPNDTVRIVSELEKRGFTKKEKIFVHASADAPELYSMSAEKGNVMDGAYIGGFSVDLGTPAEKKVLDGFRKLKGQENATKLMWGDTFYVATYLIKEAIEKTGVTGDPAKLEEERIKIRDFINNVKNFDSRLWGSISALPDGSFDIPQYLMQIKDNKPVVLISTREYFKK